MILASLPIIHVPNCAQSSVQQARQEQWVGGITSSPGCRGVHIPCHSGRQWLVKPLTGHQLQRACAWSRCLTSASLRLGGRVYNCRPGPALTRVVLQNDVAGQVNKPVVRKRAFAAAFKRLVPAELLLACRESGGVLMYRMVDNAMHLTNLQHGLPAFKTLRHAWSVFITGAIVCRTTLTCLLPLQL